MSAGDSTCGLGGHDPQYQQLYIPDSNVLLTRTQSEAGTLEVTDFMPVDGSLAGFLVRRVEVTRGTVSVDVTCSPRFDYARREPRVEAGDRAALFNSGDNALRLAATVTLAPRGAAAEARLELRAGERAAFALGPADTPFTLTLEAVYDALAATTRYWRGWIARSSYRGRWRELVHCSALTLKLLTYAPEGTLVAAPTLGLPAAIGGGRNWDYRFTWIRDAAFTLYGLSRLGFTDESRAFTAWVARRCSELAGGESLQVMYGIRGERAVDERPLPHLAGYRHSHPVHTGSDNRTQTQLDIYGALLDAAYLNDRYGTPADNDIWTELVGLTEQAATRWREPDHGLWELPSRPREYLSSKLLCWVALDRAIALATHRSLPAPIDRWRETRDTIYRDIFERFWDDDKQAFVQAADHRAMDASVLLMPLLRFISHTDPRWLSTLRAVERELVEDGLVYRYRQGNGSLDPLPGREAPFTICTFWYIECLSRAGRLDEASLAFEKTLARGNHLGLFAEQIMHGGNALGNFPQAYSHLALISTAFDIDKRSQRRWQGSDQAGT